MNDYTELKRLAEAAIEHGKSVGEEDWYCLEFLGSIYKWASIEDPGFIASANPAVVLALIAENERIDGCCKAMTVDMGKLTRERNFFRSRAEKLKTENEALRLALESCADELEGQVIQCYHGIPVEDMHPVTRRAYDRDMSGVAEARAAMKKAVKDD